jgi:phytoene desaturase
MPLRSTDPGLAPAGKEIFYILVPVPNLDNCKEDFSAGKVSCVAPSSTASTGLRHPLEDQIEVEHRFLSAGFTSRYNIPYGATFGLAHNLMQSAFLRPANFDRRIRGYNYTRGSTQPGGGLPVVLASSRIVADLIEKEAVNPRTSEEFMALA